MSFTLYDLSIPILVRSLENLLGILQKGETWAEENNIDKKTLIWGKLADDMLPLTSQIQICSNTAKDVLCHIGGEENIPMEDDEKTFEELYARIDKTVQLLRSVKKEKFSSPDISLMIKLGPHEVPFTGLTYIQRFVLPNFFFHAATAYDILRKSGVQVGKAEWLGTGTIMK